MAQSFDDAGSGDEQAPFDGAGKSSAEFVITGTFFMNVLR